jgi:hypothetical protein
MVAGLLPLSKKTVWDATFAPLFAPWSNALPWNGVITGKNMKPGRKEPLPEIFLFHLKMNGREGFIIGYLNQQKR